MAELVLTPVIQKVVEVAGNFIIQEGSRLSRLPEDMNWLGTQLKHMLAYTAAAEAKDVTDPQTTALIEQIRDLAYDVEDTLEEFVPKIKSYRSRGFIKKSASILSYCRTCRNFASEIQKIRTRVEAIRIDRETYCIPDVTDGSVADPRSVAPHIDEEPVGLDQDIEALKRKLLGGDEELLFVCVVGMGGVGKTTLARKVFQSVKGHFDCSASVPISQQPNFNDIFKDIAKQVGVQGDMENLCAFLREKRYVVFLDDIWNAETWDVLKNGFPNTNCVSGSRIIITSRDMDVGRYIGHQRSLHHLQPLDSETSWSLFSNLIMPSVRGGDRVLNGSSLEDIGRQIVEKCHGLPLEIVLTVGMLRARGPTEIAWQEVLNNIKHHQRNDQSSQILGLSYKDLPSTLKPCFLYLGIFPEDYDIRVAELVRLWMAENFIDGRSGIEPEDVGEMYVNKLISRNLVQAVSRKYDGRVKRIRIHDLLHSLCINIAKRTNFFHTNLDNPTDSFDNKMRRVAVHNEFTSDAPMLKCRTLHTFRLEDEVSRKRLKNILCKQRSLQLQVVSVGVREIAGGDLWKMESCRLKYLKLAMGGRMNTSKQNLKHLQTLDLRYCWSGGSLPSGIWTMKQLRHLLLSKLHGHNIGLQFPCSGVDICLPNLRTLSDIKYQDLYFIGTNTFPNLRKLVLCGHLADTEKLSMPEPISLKLETLGLLGSFTSQLELRVETLNLSRYINLKKLEISNITFPQLPGVDQLPPNLLKLQLSYNGLEEDPMQVLKKLPALRVLGLLKCYNGRKLDCSGADSFPQLEVLHIQELENVEEVTDGEEAEMQKLRELKVVNCPRFHTYPNRLRQLLEIVNSEEHVVESVGQMLMELLGL